VPDLVRGGAPAIDLDLLRRELVQVLDDIDRGDFYRRHQVPDAQQVIRDIAISGDGEATTAAEFPDVIELIGDICNNRGGSNQFKRVLISNGSQARRDPVQRGLEAWARQGGVMWFKLDSATAEGMARINGIHGNPDSVLANLQAAAAACPVWLQTCVFTLDGLAPSIFEQRAYLDLLRRALDAGVAIEGVMLYGLARPSQQPEAARLGKVTADWLAGFAAAIGALGLRVQVTE
jgi:wyosine [tRNA(Phe)-imidazoG37] synthetase (radical SAM superfamily)